MKKGFWVVALLFFMLIPGLVCAEPAVGLTDKGVSRAKNEDSFVILDTADLYLVADGMGVHAAGEVASAHVVQTFKDYVRMPIWGALDKVWPSSRTVFTVAAYFEANRRILHESMANPARRGMGTTAVSVVRREGYMDVVNLGDSRAYRIRNGYMVQVSHDHSLVQEYIDQGKLKTPEEIEAFPYKNIITRAMGTQPKIVPDVFSEPYRPGDIYLLCSDGLFNELADDEILKIIESYRGNDEGAARALVDAANARGGRDNITVVIVR